MIFYEVIETDGGLMVAELEPGTPPEEAAERQEGIVVDPGPYPTFEDAYDAMLVLQGYEEDEYDMP